MVRVDDMMRNISLIFHSFVNSISLYEMFLTNYAFKSDGDKTEHLKDDHGHDPRHDPSVSDAMPMGVCVNTTSHRVADVHFLEICFTLRCVEM